MAGLRVQGFDASLLGEGLRPASGSNGARCSLIQFDGAARQMTGPGPGWSSLAVSWPGCVLAVSWLCPGCVLPAGPRAYSCEKSRLILPSSGDSSEDRGVRCAYVGYSGQKWRELIEFKLSFPSSSDANVRGSAAALNQRPTTMFTFRRLLRSPLPSTPARCSPQIQRRHHATPGQAVSGLRAEQT